MEEWIKLLKSNNYLGIKKYIQSGGNVNETEENGESVICFAMRYKCDDDILDLLIDNGADLYQVDHEGVSVFDVAVTYNRLSIIKQLLADGFDVHHATRKSGFTPLMGAVCYGRIEIIELLLELGVNVYEKDAHGFTAVDFARKMHKTQVQKLFEKHGLQENVR